MTLLQPPDLAERVQQLKASRGSEEFTARVSRARKLYKEAIERLRLGEEIDWEMFRDLDIGIRLSPVSWQQLLDIVSEAIAGGDAEAALCRGEFAQEEALGQLGRSWEQLKAYYDYRDQVIARAFASMTDYLLIKIFGVPPRLCPDGRKAAALPADFHNSLRIVFRENDFPYYFEVGLEDHTVWANKPLTPKQLQQVIAEHRDGYEVVYYVNPPSLMSVPAIWHAHVVSRRKPPEKLQGPTPEEMQHQGIKVE